AAQTWSAASAGSPTDLAGTSAPARTRVTASRSRGTRLRRTGPGTLGRTLVAPRNSRPRSPVTDLPRAWSSGTVGRGAHRRTPGGVRYRSGVRPRGRPVALRSNFSDGINRIVGPIGRVVARTGISPNWLTTLGLVFT